VSYLTCKCFFHSAFRSVYLVAAYLPNRFVTSRHWNDCVKFFASKTSRCVWMLLQITIVSHTRCLTSLESIHNSARPNHRIGSRFASSTLPRRSRNHAQRRPRPLFQLCQIRSVTRHLLQQIAYPRPALQSNLKSEKQMRDSPVTINTCIIHCIFCTNYKSQN
jgi:hypothetical protein